MRGRRSATRASTPRFRDWARLPEASAARGVSTARHVAATRVEEVAARPIAEPARLLTDRPFGAVEQRAEKAAPAGPEAFHYTKGEYVASIVNKGLRRGRTRPRQASSVRYRLTSIWLCRQIAAGCPMPSCASIWMQCAGPTWKSPSLRGLLEALIFLAAAMSSTFPRGSLQSTSR